MKESTGNWLKIAEKDLKVAKLLVRENEPMAFIFHLHAALEKILKAICCEESGEPPRIHKLRSLAIDVCKLSLEKHQLKLITQIDESFMDSRYPEDITEFENTYPREVCEKLLEEVEGTFKWLQSLLN
jgi:HEPN domain-containing protein